MSGLDTKLGPRDADSAPTSVTPAMTSPKPAPTSQQVTPKAPEGPKTPEQASEDTKPEYKGPTTRDQFHHGFANVRLDAFAGTASANVGNTTEAPLGADHTGSVVGVGIGYSIGLRGKDWHLITPNLTYSHFDFSKDTPVGPSEFTINRLSAGVDWTWSFKRAKGFIGLNLGVNFLFDFYRAPGNPQNPTGLEGVAVQDNIQLFPLQGQGMGAGAGLGIHLFKQTLMAQVGAGGTIANGTIPGFDQSLSNRTYWVTAHMRVIQLGYAIADLVKYAKSKRSQRVPVDKMTRVAEQKNTAPVTPMTAEAMVKLHEVILADLRTRSQARIGLPVAEQFFSRGAELEAQTNQALQAAKAKFELGKQAYGNYARPVGLEGKRSREDMEATKAALIEASYITESYYNKALEVAQLLEKYSVDESQKATVNQVKSDYQRFQVVYAAWRKNASGFKSLDQVFAELDGTHQKIQSTESDINRNYEVLTELYANEQFKPTGGLINYQELAITNLAGAIGFHYNQIETLAGDSEQLAVLAKDQIAGLEKVAEKMADSQAKVVFCQRLSSTKQNIEEANQFINEVKRVSIAEAVAKMIKKDNLAFEAEVNKPIPSKDEGRKKLAARALGHYKNQVLKLKNMRDHLIDNPPLEIKPAREGKSTEDFLKDILAPAEAEVLKARRLFLIVSTDYRMTLESFEKETRQKIAPAIRRNEELYQKELRDAAYQASLNNSHLKEYDGIAFPTGVPQDAKAATEEAIVMKVNATKPVDSQASKTAEAAAKQSGLTADQVDKAVEKIKPSQQPQAQTPVQSKANVTVVPVVPVRPTVKDNFIPAAIEDAKKQIAVIDQATAKLKGGDFDPNAAVTVKKAADHAVVQLDKVEQKLAKQSGKVPADGPHKAVREQLVGSVGAWHHALNSKISQQPNNQTLKIIYQEAYGKPFRVVQQPTPKDSSVKIAVKPAAPVVPKVEVKPNPVRPQRPLAMQDLKLEEYKPILQDIHQLQARVAELKDYKNHGRLKLRDASQEVTQLGAGVAKLILSARGGLISAERSFEPEYYSEKQQKEIISQRERLTVELDAAVRDWDQERKGLNNLGPAKIKKQKAIAVMNAKYEGMIRNALQPKPSSKPAISGAVLASSSQPTRSVSDKRLAPAEMSSPILKETIENSIQGMQELSKKAQDKASEYDELKKKNAGEQVLVPILMAIYDLGTEAEKELGYLQSCVNNFNTRDVTDEEKASITGKYNSAVAFHDKVLDLYKQREAA